MIRKEAEDSSFPRRMLDLGILVILGILAAVAPTTVLAYVHPMALAFDARSESQSMDAIVELHCLALNIYHEARSESLEGKLAVGQVTMNRVRSAHYPNSICKVVWQRGQFSWTHDGRSDRPHNPEAWNEALRIAMITCERNAHGLVGRATHYHAVYVRPYWTKAFRYVGRIGRHVFYEASEHS